MIAAVVVVGAGFGVSVARAEADATAPTVAAEPPVAAPGVTAADAYRPGASTYQPREIPAFPSIPVAVGVNSPIGWHRRAIGTSLYAGLSRHHAIRANFAYYGHNDLLGEFLNGIVGGEGAWYSGRVIDYGIGLVWYSRRRWDGFMLEAGALLRDRETRTAYEFDIVKAWTTTIGARGMIGWTWRIGPAFLAAAVGLSVGREWGREAKGPSEFSPTMGTVTSDVSRPQVDGEAYLRLGWALGD